MLNLTTSDYDVIRSDPVLSFLKRPHPFLFPFARMKYIIGAFPGVTRVNAAAMMVVDAATEFAMAAFLRAGDEGFRLCFFEDQGPLVCFDDEALERSTRMDSFAAATIGSTYFYAGVLGNGSPLFRVQGVDSRSPLFDATPFDIPAHPPGDTEFYAHDVTDLEQGRCANNGDCVLTGDDKATSFLIALAQDARALLLVSVDASETPTSYLWVYGIDVHLRDGTVTKKGDKALGNFGACFTFSHRGNGQARVACASNDGAGLFGIDLPLDLTPCRNLWAPFGTEPGLCNLRNNPSRPSVRYLVDSERTNSNDGLACAEATIPELSTPPPLKSPSPIPTTHLPTTKPTAKNEPTDKPTTKNEPTDKPTAKPTELPTELPSARPTTELPTETEPPTDVPTTATSANLATDVPTSSNATQAILLTSSFLALGVEDFDLGGDKVVRYSVTDVIDFIDNPDVDVVDATATILSRRRRLLAGNSSGSIAYAVFLESPAAKGFSSPRAALDSMQSQVNASLNSGYLQERFDYWATFLGSPFLPTLRGMGPDSGWQSMPIAGPTAVPSALSTSTTAPTSTSIDIGANSPPPASNPTRAPTAIPSDLPAASPSLMPTTPASLTLPDVAPTRAPTATLTYLPTYAPTHAPTYAPTTTTELPTSSPAPTLTPTATRLPSSPSSSPSEAPTATAAPSELPTAVPSASPTTTASPTTVPSVLPTASPTRTPTYAPTTSELPTIAPTNTVTYAPTSTKLPTVSPTTLTPATISASLKLEGDSVTFNETDFEKNVESALASLEPRIVAVQTTQVVNNGTTSRRRLSQSFFVVQFNIAVTLLSPGIMSSSDLVDDIEATLTRAFALGSLLPSSFGAIGVDSLCVAPIEAPKLSAAKFDKTGLTIVLTFDVDTNQAERPVGEPVDCSDLFDVDPSLSCRWVAKNIVEADASGSEARSRVRQIIMSMFFFFCVVIVERWSYFLTLCKKEIFLFQ